MPATENRAGLATVEVGGQRFDHWTHYSIDSDLFTAADGFRLSVGLPGVRTADDKRERQRMRDLLAPGSSVKVYVGEGSTNADARRLQMTGVIDDLTITGTSDGGTVVEIEGRDNAAHLVDASVPLDVFQVTQVRKRRLELAVNSLVAANPSQNVTTTPYAFSFEANPGTTVTTWTVRQGMTLAQLAIVVADLWGIDVRVDPSAGRDILTGRPRGTRATVDARRGARGTSYASGQSPDDVKAIKVAEARPHPGETAWAYLERHCKRLGVMMWFAPDGTLVLGSPQYMQESRGRIVRRLKSEAADPNNVIEGEVKRSIGDRYSQVTAMGRSNRAGKTKVSATAVDPDWALGFSKPLTIQDHEIRDVAAATRRAERELARHKASALTLHYVLDGHASRVGDQSFLFATDTMLDVVDEVAGIEGRYYVIKRTFECGRDGKGTLTRLALVPPNSIVL